MADKYGYGRKINLPVGVGNVHLGDRTFKKVEFELDNVLPQDETRAYSIISCHLGATHGKLESVRMSASPGPDYDPVDNSPDVEISLTNDIEHWNVNAADTRDSTRIPKYHVSEIYYSGVQTGDFVENDINQHFTCKIEGAGKNDDLFYIIIRNTRIQPTRKVNVEIWIEIDPSEIARREG